MSRVRASRYHDFSYGHRIDGHESKCRFLHGHNGRVHFVCQGELDTLGRVLDFSVIKEKLCQWVEDNWDHKFLLWEKDHWFAKLDEAGAPGIIAVPFNPTAENMGIHLIDVIGPTQLEGTGVTLVKVEIEETRKCSAEVMI